MKRSIIFFCVAAIVYMCGVNLHAINRYFNEEEKEIQKIEKQEKKENKKEKSSTKKKVEEKKVAKSTEIEEKKEEAKKEEENKSSTETSNEQKSSGKNLNQSGAPYTNTVTVSNLNDIDILVNNAGITRDGLIMKMSEEDFDDVLRTNLKGAFHTIRHLSRYFLKQKSGTIINISSVSGVMGNAGQANYAASKAGIIGLTKTVARELASRNVCVNAVAPGFIGTDMTDAMPKQVKEEVLDKIPLGKMGTPADVAQAVLFLAGEQSDYITGQVLCVDGGMAM